MGVIVVIVEREGERGAGLRYDAGNGEHKRRRTLVTLRKIVSKNLREVRTQQRLSQETIAKRSGISVSYVSMLERGMRTPPLETLESLAKALHVSPLYLLQELDGGPRKPRRG